MNEIIGTMVAAFLESMCKNDAGAQIAMRDALRAAKAEGWELCKLPEPQEYSGHVPAEDGDARQYWADGFSSCLDEIERLELEGEDG